MAAKHFFQRGNPDAVAGQQVARPAGGYGCNPQDRIGARQPPQALFFTLLQEKASSKRNAQAGGRAELLWIRQFQGGVEPCRENILSCCCQTSRDWRLNNGAKRRSSRTVRLGSRLPARMDCAGGEVMRTIQKASKAVALAGLALALAGRSDGRKPSPARPVQHDPVQYDPVQHAPAEPGPSGTPPASTPAAQPAPGTAPVGETLPPPRRRQPIPPQRIRQSDSKDKPAPGTTPVAGDAAAHELSIRTRWLSRAARRST